MISAIFGPAYAKRGPLAGRSVPRLLRWIVPGQQGQPALDHLIQHWTRPWQRGVPRFVEPAPAPGSGDDDGGSGGGNLVGGGYRFPNIGTQLIGGALDLADSVGRAVFSEPPSYVPTHRSIWDQNPAPLGNDVLDTPISTRGGHAGPWGSFPDVTAPITNLFESTADTSYTAGRWTAYGAALSVGPTPEALRNDPISQWRRHRSFGNSALPSLGGRDSARYRIVESLIAGSPPQYSSSPLDMAYHHALTFNAGPMARADEYAQRLGTAAAGFGLMSAAGLPLPHEWLAPIDRLGSAGAFSAVHQARTMRHKYHNGQATLEEVAQAELSAALNLSPFATSRMAGVAHVKDAYDLERQLDVAGAYEKAHEKVLNWLDPTDRARGGRVRHGETTRVGERGPEIVRLPANASTASAQRSRRLAQRSGTSAVSRQARREMHLRQHLDGREVARSTVRHVDDEKQWGWA